MGSKPDLTRFTGVILAGGKSSRMGRDKAAIKINGKPMLGHVVDTLFQIFADVLTVQDKPGHYDSLFDDELKKPRMVADDQPHQGPIGGFKRALREIHTPYFFVVPCDAPFLNPEVIQYLCSLMREDLAAVVPRVGGALQPLLACYHTARISAVLDLDHAEFKSPRVLVEHVQGTCVLVSENDLQRIDPGLGTFLDFNTPVGIKVNF